MHVVTIYAVVALLLYLLLEYTDVFGPLLRKIGVLGVSLVVGWWTSLGIKRLLSSRHKVPPDGLAVVIAGCDSEHGFVTASHLRRYGYYVLAGTQDVGGEMARGMEKLKVDVVELQASNEGSVNDAFQDISERLLKEASVRHGQRAHQPVLEPLRVLVLWCAEKRLHALVCNVGSGDLGELEWISNRALRRALDETMVSTARLVNRFLPLLRESRGRVVICAGPSGRVAVPGAGVHSIVNAALIAYAECLRREMFKFMVQVALVEPVWINYRTPVSRLHSPGVTIKEVLNDLSREVFEDYSLGYANAFRTLWNRRTTRWYMGPPDTLASCTCRAVNDRVAQPVYACGYTNERVANEVLQRLPSHLVDMAQCFLYQPFAKLRVWSEVGDDSGGALPARERIAGPRCLQRLLTATLSPKPVSLRASGMSTPARDLQTLRAEFFTSSERTEDVTPPPNTPPPVVQVKGEAFQPRRSQDDVNAGPSYPGTGQPSPFPGAEQTQPVNALPPSEQTVPQGGAVTQQSSDDATSSDPTTSLQPPSDSSNTASSVDGAKDGAGHVTPPADGDVSTILLDVMEETEHIITASMLMPVSQAVCKRTTPYPFNGTEKVVVRPAERAPPQQRPMRARLEMPQSPRSPYFTGIQSLPRNFMELISPPSEQASPSAGATGEEHSRSPIDSTTGVQVADYSSPLPDSSGSPRHFIGTPHSESPLTDGTTPQAEQHPNTDVQDQGSLRRRRTTKDDEEPQHF